MEIDSTLITIIISATCGSLAGLTLLGWWVINSVKKSYQSRIVTNKIRKQLAQATAYREKLESLLKNASKKQEQARLKVLVDRVNAWTDDIEALARRVDGFKQDKLIRRDLMRLPSTIKDLRRKLEREDNAELRTKLKRTLESRQKHLASLEKLQETMQKAELEMELTLSSLGTIYSQVVTGQSSNQVANYSHLTAEVDEQVNVLQDYLSALDEVHQERAVRLSLDD